MARLTRELSTNIRNDDLASAAELAAKLDEAVQAQKRLWLVRDSDDRAREVLSWLPADLEGFFVNQMPFVVSGQEESGSQGERTAQSYSIDRLKAQSAGRYYQLLQGHTIRLVIAGTRGVLPASSTVSVPSPMTSRDAIYFYFLADDLMPPPPDESIEGAPVWQTTASIAGPFVPGSRTPPPNREDTNWVALVRPNRLVVSNQREFLSDTLQLMRSGTANSAADFPEWSLADRSSSLWGVRHYTPGSKPKESERGCDQWRLPHPDCNATGATMRFDAMTERLEIQYLSKSPLTKTGAGLMRSIDREFQIDQPQPGCWRMVSDINKRGAWPLFFGFTMLGFGMYR